MLRDACQLLTGGLFEVVGIPYQEMALVKTESLTNKNRVG